MGSAKQGEPEPGGVPIRGYLISEIAFRKLETLLKSLRGTALLIEERGEDDTMPDIAASDLASILYTHADVGETVSANALFAVGSAEVLQAAS